MVNPTAASPLHAEIVDYLLSRLQAVKRENAQLRSTLTSPTTPPPNSVGFGANDAVDVRVLEASREVARAKLLPPATRPDLDIHKQGRKVVQKIKAKDVEGVSRLLAQYPEVVTMRSGGNGYTLLHVAAGSGAVEVVRFLLQHFEQIHPLATDLFGRTPLHVAADTLQAEICSLFLEKLGQHDRSLVGENAPQDIVGLTPAGCSALKSVRKEEERSRRRKCTDLLHRAGDACISPMPQKLPKPKTYVVDQTRSAARRSSLFKETVVRNDVAYRLAGRAIVHGHASMPGFRVTMEDAACLAPEVEVGGGRSVSLFAVFDGHGGRGAAEYCAENLLRIFKDQPAVISGEVVESREELRATLRNTCWKMEEELRQWEPFVLRENVVRAAMGDEPAQVEVKARDNSGTTCIIVVLCDEYFAIANVGDCRAVLNTAGNVLQLSRDHKPMVSPIDVVAGPADITPLQEAEDFYAQERKRIVAAGGGITENGYVVSTRENPKEQLAMTRSLGDFQYKQNKALPLEKQVVIAEPEVSVHSWEGYEGDFLVLACDGVWDVMTNIAVVDFLRRELAGQETSEDALDQACHKLLLECLRLESEDNMTVVLLSLERPSTGQISHERVSLQPAAAEEKVNRDLFTQDEMAEEEENIQDLI